MRRLLLSVLLTALPLCAAEIRIAGLDPQPREAVEKPRPLRLRPLRATAKKPSTKSTPPAYRPSFRHGFTLPARSSIRHGFTKPANSTIRYGR